MEALGDEMLTMFHAQKMMDGEGRGIPVELQPGRSSESTQKDDEASKSRGDKDVFDMLWSFVWLQGSFVKSGVLSARWCAVEIWPPLPSRVESLAQPKKYAKNPKPATSVPAGAALSDETSSALAHGGPSAQDDV